MVLSTFSAVILKMAYGIDVKDESDEMLTYIDAGMEGIRKLAVSGGFVVDSLPFLRYLPSYVPGCGFQKTFAQWRERSALWRNTPFKHYQDAVVGVFATTSPYAYVSL